MKILRIIFTIIFTIVFSALLIAMPFWSSFNRTIIDRETISISISDSGINKQAEKIINKSIDEFLNTLEANLRKEYNINDKKVNSTIEKIKIETSDILKKFSTSDNIDRFINSTLEFFYEKKEINFGELIKTNMNKIIEENNIEIDEKSIDEINKYIDKLTIELNNELVKQSEGYIKLNEHETAIINPIPKFIELMNQVEDLLIGLIIVLCIIILLINIKHILFGTISVLVGTTISGILLLISGKIITIFRDTFITDSTNSILLLGKSLINNIISVINLTGLIYVIIGVLSIVGINVFKKIKNKHKDSSLSNKNLIKKEKITE